MLSVFRILVRGWDLDIGLSPADTPEIGSALPQLGRAGFRAGSALGALGLRSSYLPAT